MPLISETNKFQKQLEEEKNKKVQRARGSSHMVNNGKFHEWVSTTKPIVKLVLNSCFLYTQIKLLIVLDVMFSTFWIKPNLKF